MCECRFCVIRVRISISGVPRGSILGPILFIFLINDLPTDIIAKLLLFADDTKLIKMLLSMMSHSELQNDLNHLISWSEKWQLKFNTSKCKVLRFGQSDTKPYTMMNIDIGQKQELKFIDEETYSKIIQFSRHSFIQVFVYFSYSPSSWILRYGLVSTTKKRWRFNRKRPSPCFQDVTTVIKFNLWRETCENWNTKHEIS